MQLNNTKTGEVIRIEKYRFEENSIIYGFYEAFGNFSNQPAFKKALKFKNLKLKDLLSQTVNIEETCLKELKEELNLTDFEISGDFKNWLFPDRPIRIFINNDFILEQLQPIDSEGNLSEIGQLIERERKENFGFYIKNSKYTVIYVNKVDETDSQIIYPYLNKTIFVETQNG